MATQALPPGFSFVDDEPVTPPAAKAASALPAGFSFVDDEPVKVARPKQGFLPGTEEFEGKVPGVPEPRNPITQPKSDTPEFVKAAYEGKFGVPAPANLGTAFKEPWESITAGVAQMAEPLPPGPKLPTGGPAAGLPGKTYIGPDQAAGLRKILNGAVGIVSGPESIGPMIAASPVGAPLTLGAAKVAGVATEKGLTAAGVPPEYAGLGGDVVSLAVAGGGARYLVGKADAALEAHNAAAARWLEQERTGGLQKEKMDEIFAGESHPITVNGKEATVEYMGASKKGRTGFRVVDADGKVLVGGRARDVQDWLQSNGAAPLPSDKAVPIESLKEPPAIVREAPAPAAPALPEGFEYAEPPAPSAEFTKGQEFKTPEGTYRVKNVKGVTVQARLETPDGKNVPVMASIERFKGLVGTPTPVTEAAETEPVAAPTPTDAALTPSEAPSASEKPTSLEVEAPTSTVEPAWGSKLPGFVRDKIEERVSVADKLGISDEIEELAAKRMTAGETAKELADKLDSVEPAERKEIVRAVRARRGIPSLDNHTEFEEWIKGRVPEVGAETPEKQAHDYSTTQVNLPESIAGPVRKAGADIPDAQLAEDGRETEPHVTVKYGLTGEDSVPVTEAVAGHGPVTVKLGKASVFHTPEADVLKVDVDSPDLHALNGKVSKLPNEDKHPDYVPHATIAYLKPGQGAQYDGKEIPGVTGQEITLDSVSFRDRAGNATDIPLTGSGEAAGEGEVIQPESAAPQQPAAEVTAAPEKSIVESEQNAPDATAGENPEALAGVPSGDVRGDGEGGNAPRTGPERGQVDEGLDSPTGGTGTAAESGEGTDERTVGVPSGGERSPETRRGSDRGSTPTSTDYRITPADHIGEGSIKQKANDNLAAIRLLKQIEAEGREATPDEQKTLVKYVGWGGMPQPFMENGVPRDWQGVRAELDSLLTTEEFASARASTPNAHYTSPMVIEGIWNALGRLGFSPHETYTMLEPAMGAGHFFGMTPEGIADRAQRVGIELDSITGRIAKLLYPQVDVHVSGFEKVRLPNDYFDLAVSNVPFGNYGIHDPAYKRVPGVTKSIHDYFFAKALDKVRPGGVVAFITSNFTMDKGDPFIRKYLADRADLLGAIRLPNTAFKGNAGTEVTTDIIFLQKRPPQVPAAGEKWAETQPVAATRKRPDGTMGEGTVQVNEYFARHPEMMLGKMGLEGTMYGPNQAALIGDLTPEKFQAAIDKLPAGVVLPWKAPEQPFTTLASIPSSGAVKEGAFAVHDGQVVVRQGDKLVPADIPADQATRIKAMMGVRDAVREVFRTQIDESTDRAINMAREKLNLVYDIFVKKHGYLHDRKNVRAYADDPDAPLVLSLEDWDPDTKTAKKTAVFKERTIDKYKPAEKADNATDALSISLNERGRLDWVRMQELTGKTPSELQEELGPLVYQNPSGKVWEPADEYLSGNVRSKLAEAENAARGNKAFERNVEALKAVQPKDLEPGEINGRLGASWIPKEDVRDFVAQLLEMEPRTIHIGHSEALATWTMKLTRPETVANKRTYGTDRFTGAELIDDALNLRNPTAYDWVGSGSERRQVVNEQQTLAARQMLEQIKEKFGNWVWEDPERAKRLAETYNQEFNSLRLREYDGSHLSFPGSSAAIVLRKHQKNAAWRMIQAGNTLLAHVVGAGKTLEIVAGAMEMRRLGLAKKPMIVVPKNRVGGTAEEFLSMYPAANILVMSSEDFAPGNRQKMMGRIATGNWDSVIVSYESFEKLPVSDDTFNSYLQTQIDDLENYIRESKGDQADARIVKELEKSKKRLEAKLRDKADRESKDEALTFEELGVDQLFVDEFDSFKNLFFPTKMTRIAGIPNTESKRAFDMYIKSQHIVGMNSGKRGLVGATGTPIANSMAEMWTMQRYLQPQYLRDHGLQHFDAWAQTFGEVQPTLEMSPDGGGLRIVNRFNKFVNIPELVAGFRLMADVQTAEMLNLPVPKLKGGKMRTISAKASEQQMAYLQSLVKRAAAIKGKPVKKGGDNMLVIGTDGQKSALDIRLVDPGAPDNPTSKVNKAVDEIVKIWKQTSDKRSTQLVFLDRSTPAGPREQKFSVYDDMKAKLIARGIPKTEVAFIHDAETDAEKENLFRNVNSGKIRIVIGGTQKMGVGVNVQRKLYAAHHLDAPYRPRDIEQRNGRILRQGNENGEVEIVNYVTEPSFDARSWDILRNKAYFIGQVMRGDVSVRTAEDISDQAVTFAEISAIASGNPAIREKTIVDSEVRKLDSLRARHSQQQAAVRRDLQNIPMTIKAEQEGLARLESDIATRDSSKPEFTIGKETFTGKDARKKAGEVLHDILKAHEKDKTILGEPMVVGSYRGLRLLAQGSTFTDTLPRIIIKGKGGYEVNTNQSGDPDGTITSIESVIRNLDGRKNQAVRAIEDAEKKLVDTKKLAGHPFEQEQKLKDLLARQDELAKQLQAKPAEQPVGGEDDDLDTDHPEDLDDLQAMKQEVKAKSVKADTGPLGSESGSAIFPDSAAKALQKAALSVKQARHDILSMVAPAANAPETALTVRQRAAQLARSDARAEAALEDARKALRMMPAAERWDAYDRAERGVSQATPELDSIFSVMRKLLDDSRRDVQGLGTGKLESFIENYLPHVYKNPQQAEAMFAAYYAKNPLEGKKSFLKKRKYETLKDAMDSELEPITDNPVDQVLIKVHEMQKYVMAHRILHDEKDAGRVKYYNVKQKPHGVGEINDKISTVFGPHMVDPQHPGMPFITIVGHYYATNEDEARIINNYLSPGLRGVPLFRGYLAMANTMNQFQLGFSAFHLGFVTMDAAISKTALGIYQAAHGSPIKGAVSVLSTPVAPFMNIIRGDKMLKEYYKPGTQGGRLGTLVDAMVMAGGRARMDTFYQAQTARNAADIMRQASLLSRGIGAAIGGALGSTMGPAGTVAGAGLGATFGARGLADVFAKPVMEYLVPRMKMGVFADLAEFELQRLGEGRLTDEEIQAALARAWDSVDNRMGQLVYDNLFWKKSHKDLLMASVRSVGWNTGTIREVGGGVADLKLLATGRPAIGMKNTPGGWSPEVSTRLSYAIALPIVAGIVGSIIYYLSTGEHPETLKDRYFPRSGARGTPGWSKRLSLPTYIKDIVHVHHKGIVDTVQGKLHPFLTLLGDMLNNEDYYGDQIHNWNDPMVKQAQAVASHILESYTPMTMKPPAGKRPPVETTRDKVLKFGGITPAPKYIQDNARTPRGYRRIPVYAP